MGQDLADAWKKPPQCGSGVAQEAVTIPPTLAPEDQLEVPIACASVPVVMPGLSHDNARAPA